VSARKGLGGLPRWDTDKWRLADRGCKSGAMGGDRWIAGLLVIEDRGGGPLRFRQRPQRFGRRVDFKDFGLALVGGQVTAFEVAEYLGRLNGWRSGCCAWYLAAISARQA
jgi:hypothetical protein